MNGLPAVLTRPTAVLPDIQAAPVPGQMAEATAVGIALDNGVPALVPLSGDRALVLSVGLGQARRLLDADPADIIVAAGTATVPPADPSAWRDPDAPIARLSLLDGATLGDSVPVVAGVAAALTVAGRAVAEVTVDAITLTAGSLRSPGQYGSSLTMHWRDLQPAADAGPPLATGDDSIPRLRLGYGLITRGDRA
jgi:hypothetical protein